MNYGYIEPVIEPDHYVLGALALPVLVPGGQWDAFLPEDELQNRGFETYVCTSEGTTNAVEVLEKQEYGDTDNWSDRWLAYKTGTQYRAGNDPHTVAEYLRKNGDVHETDWPFDVANFTEFYKEPPKGLDLKAQEFIDEYDFGHQWILNPTQKDMMDALEKSPLGVGVYAWAQDPNTGYYVRKGSDCHWTLCYGYDRNNYWKIFDSYDNTHKKLAWDFGFTTVKQYTLHKQLANTPQAQTAWQKFRALIQSIIDAIS